MNVRTTRPAAEPVEADKRARLLRANVNPTTGLATDYLNHFNEAIMLLEMLSDCPECIGDFLTWKPMTYREHFSNSRFRDRQIAIEAYDAADPALRRSFENLADAMTAMLEETRDAMAGASTRTGAVRLATHSAAQLRPLVARAGAIINGEGEEPGAAAPQTAVDDLFKR